METSVQTASPQRFFHMPRLPNYNKQPFYIPKSQQNHNMPQTNPTGLSGAMFDGKRMRKAVHRKTIDYNSSVLKYLENRIWQRDHRDVRCVQPDVLYQAELVPPPALLNKPMNCVTTKFVRTSTNKIRCPIFCVTWTPEGRRLVTGASSGEFTLWNGLLFNFETILQAHDSSVRAMVWSHNDQWMVTADHAGYIKYWQSNMNNVKMYQAHKEPIRGISFCPMDTKLATCSDDGTVRIWDFAKCHEEKILRGHGADVKCVDWHPQKNLIASGSKDNQQPVKLWDPRQGQSLATIHAHKMTVMELKWNRNGNWLLTASRDHLLKIYDIRNMKDELQTFKGHKKEATAVAWHPIHESMFASGGSDGGLMFWIVGTDKEVGGMEEAHDGMIWSLAWHPLGHILASGSNDHTTKFWTRNRPGDKMRDKYNLNTLGMGELELDYDTEPHSVPNLPGMGLEHGVADSGKPQIDIVPGAGIPGLDWDKEVEVVKHTEHNIHQRKKVPYSRPVPRQFEQAWAENKQPGILVPDSDGNLKVMPKQGQPKHNPPALMEMPVQNQPGQRPRGPGQEQQRMPGPGQGPRGQFMHPGPDGMNQGPRFNNQGGDMRGRNDMQGMNDGPRNQGPIQGLIDGPRNQGPSPGIIPGPRMGGPQPGMMAGRGLLEHPRMGGPPQRMQVDPRGMRPQGVLQPRMEAPRMAMQGGLIRENSPRGPIHMDGGPQIRGQMINPGNRLTTPNQGMIDPAFGGSNAQGPPGQNNAQNLPPMAQQHGGENQGSMQPQLQQSFQDNDMRLRQGAPASAPSQFPQRNDGQRNDGQRNDGERNDDPGNAPNADQDLRQLNRPQEDQGDVDYRFSDNPRMRGEPTRDRDEREFSPSVGDHKWRDGYSDDQNYDRGRPQDDSFVMRDEDDRMMAQGQSRDHSQSRGQNRDGDMRDGRGEFRGRESYSDSGNEYYDDGMGSRKRAWGSGSGEEQDVDLRTSGRYHDQPEDYREKVMYRGSENSQQWSNDPNSPQGRGRGRGGRGNRGWRGRPGRGRM